MRTHAPTACLIAALAAPSLHADTIGQAITTGDFNVTYSNPHDPLGGGTAFTSPGDAFAILARPANIPFALGDDSAGSFPGDLQGFIAAGDTDPFFGITDVFNDDLSTIPSATFTFDTSNTTGPLTVTIDIAGMGDFEDGVNSSNFDPGNIPSLSDYVSVQFQGSGLNTVGVGSIVDAAPDDSVSRDYTMDGGAVVNYLDPMNLNSLLDGNVPLTEDFTTMTFVVPETANLTITIEAFTDSGSEAIALRNLVVTGDVIPEPASAALLAAATLLLDRRRRAA